MNGKLTRALGFHSSGLSLIRCLSQSLIKAAACERPVRPNIISLSIWVLVYIKRTLVDIKREAKACTWADEVWAAANGALLIVVRQYLLQYGHVA